MAYPLASTREKRGFLKRGAISLASFVTVLEISGLKPDLNPENPISRHGFRVFVSTKILVLG